MDENPLPVEALTDIQGDEEWRRLSPIAILYFAASAIRVLAGNFVYLIPAFAVSYNQITDNPGMTIPIIGGLFSLLLLYALLSYYFYQFRLAQDSVEIRAGVFAKKHINLPFSRIQNITLEQPIYYRVTNYVCLQLDTAGSAKQEAKIVAMPLDAGNALKQHILAKKDEQSGIIDSDISSETPIESQEQVLNRRSIKDLIIHGITNNRVWIILGAAAPFYDNISGSVASYLQSIGIDLEQILSSQTIAWWQFGLYALSLAMIIMLLLTLFSVAGSILVFYGFTLSKTHDRYVRRSGLLTRQEVSMKLSRLQVIVRKQDWLDRLLGRINLQLEQNNSGVKGANELANTNKILVPSVKEAECKLLIEDAFPGNNLSTTEFTAISKRFLLRYYLLWVFPVFTFLTSVTLYQARYTELIVVLVVTILICILIYMRWLRWGYAFDDEFIYVRKGMLGVDYYCFPIHKVQQTQFKQSVLMKRRGLATCRLILASGGITIPFISQASCYELINNSLYKVESEKQSWM